MHKCWYFNSCKKLFGKVFVKKTKTGIHSKNLHYMYSQQTAWQIGTLPLFLMENTKGILQHSSIYKEKWLQMAEKHDFMLL